MYVVLLPIFIGVGKTASSGSTKCSRGSDPCVNADADADVEGARTPAGGKRTRPTGGYDETARRLRRRHGTIRYVERREYAGAKRSAIVVGAAAVERTVRGRYEWRDAKERPIGRYESKRKRYWEDEERRAVRK